MSKFGSNLDLHNNIGQALDKLSSGELAISDLDALVGNSRELYERMLILRYKAFENQVHGTQTINAPVIEHTSEPKKEDVVVPDEPPAIEFALFGEMPETSNESTESQVFVENKPDEVKVDIQPTPQESNIKEQNPSINQAVTGTSLLDKLSTNSNSSGRLGDQLKKSRIESIPGALTLNDKIRFTKNLFDGNTETFNAAIQLLDAQKSMLEAKDLITQYASRYEWNMEDKNALDFYEFVERRYA